MNTTVINIKTQPELKKQAQDIAEELGFSLSSLINAYLKHFVRTKTVAFTLNEEPSDYLIKSLEQSKKDIEAGRVYSFPNPDDTLGFIDSLIHDAPRKETKKS